MALAFNPSSTNCKKFRYLEFFKMCGQEWFTLNKNTIAKVIPGQSTYEIM
jgi:hypothetical protein